jgi:hypothetical protein
VDADERTDAGAVPSRDYHQYVFRDGRLVGDFEAMYRNSATVPWHQDEQSDWIDVRMTRELLRDLAPFAEIRDFGSGTGHYLELLCAALGAGDCIGQGYDVAPSACRIASGNFPARRFAVHDITAGPVPDAGADRARPAGRRLSVIRGTLWYVYPKLAAVVANLRASLRDDDRLLVVQNFPPLDKPFIGKDVMPDHHALVRHFSASFALLRHVWYEDRLRAANDNWFLGLFSPKGA